MGREKGSPRSSPDTSACVLMCAPDGTVEEVRQWIEHGPAPPAVGSPFTSILDQGSNTKAERFLEQIESKGVAADWQMNVPAGTSVATFRFNGAISGGSILVIAAPSRDVELYEELSRVNSELTAMHREVARKNRELEEHTSRLRSILSSIHAGVLEVDRDGRIRYANQALERMTGVSVSQLAGRRFPDAFELRVRPDGDSTAPEESVRSEVTDPERNFHFDKARLTARDVDTSVSVAGAAVSIVDAAGGIVGKVVSMSDLTAMEHHQRMLLSTARLEASRTITAGLAHNINNLMTVVLSHTELLRMNETAGESGGDRADTSQIDAIEDAARKASALADRMMYYTQERVCQPRVVDLNDVVRSVLEDLSVRDHVRIVSRISSESADVHSEPEQLHALVFNLLHNAEEAIEGEGTVAITTTVQDDQTTSGGDDSAGAAEDGPTRHRAHARRVVWRLAIEDDGAGMDGETRERACEPFFTTKFLGRGLGLAAVSGIVRAHGGTLGIRSTPGEGTRVDVTLPLAAGNGGETEAGHEGEDEAAEQGHSEKGSGADH